jgi:Tfp pilus assembly protein PilO
MKRIILFTLLGLLLAGGYFVNRQQAIQHLRAEYARLQTEKSSLQQKAAEVAELAQRYRAETNIAAFTEALYGCARTSGIRDHEVVTTRASVAQQSRGRRGRDQGVALQMSRMEVSLSGDFRQVAQYVDQVQKLDPYKRISQLTLTPGERKLNATLMIDLFSIGEPHAR